MAKQGNYVTLPGVSADYTSGLGDAFSTLSKSLLAQDADEKERARQDALLATENARYNAKQARLELEQGREDKEYQLGLDQREAVKNAQYNDAAKKAIQTHKAKTLFGVTDEQFETFRDKGLLDKIPVLREDVQDHFARIHASRFGTPFDPASTAHLYNTIDSDAELQAREDANASAEAAQLKTAADYDIRKANIVASLIGKTGSGGSSGTGTSSKALNSINKLGMVGDLQGSDLTNLYGIMESQQEIGLNTAKEIEEALVTSYPNLTPAQLNASVIYALGDLRTGANLDHINTDADDVATATSNAVRNITANPSQYGFNSAGSIDFGSAKEFKPVIPRNVKAERRERVRKDLQELFNPTPTRTSQSTPRTKVATSSSVPTTKKQPAGTSKTILNSAATEDIAPAPTPVFSKDGTALTADDIPIFDEAAQAEQYALDELNSRPKTVPADRGMFEKLWDDFSGGRSIIPNIDLSTHAGRDDLKRNLFRAFESGGGGVGTGASKLIATKAGKKVLDEPFKLLESSLKAGSKAADRVKTLETKYKKAADALADKPSGWRAAGRKNAEARLKRELDEAKDVLETANAKASGVAEKLLDKSLLDAGVPKSATARMDLPSKQAYYEYLQRVPASVRNQELTNMRNSLRGLETRNPSIPR